MTIILRDKRFDCLFWMRFEKWFDKCFDKIWKVIWQDLTSDLTRFEKRFEKWFDKTRQVYFREVFKIFSDKIFQTRQVFKEIFKRSFQTSFEFYLFKITAQLTTEHEACLLFIVLNIYIWLSGTMTGDLNLLW
jgi:hypothetical protein